MFIITLFIPNVKFIPGPNVFLLNILLKIRLEFEDAIIGFPS